MKRIIAALILPLLSACAPAPINPSEASRKPADVNVPAFSGNATGGLPGAWKPLVILRTKKQTQYQLVDENGKTVLHARAVGSSSALMHEVNTDPLQQPWLTWQWKIADLLKTADNTQRATEDSPVRIILGFDGDKDNLPFADQILFDTAKLITGHDFPYATLMYIWENRLPVGSIINSSHSGRIKMLVAASGPEGIGQWKAFTRNIVEDYEKAFGEKPGRLLGVGVLTDTDNTGETIDAWYGDIRLLSKMK
jgi:hypothetical protein